MKLLYALFFLSFIVAKSQTQLINHGSYSIAVVCKDGIIVGVDSRASFTKKSDTFKLEKNPLAYYDSVNKIFCFRKFCYKLDRV